MIFKIKQNILLTACIAFSFAFTQVDIEKKGKEILNSVSKKYKSHKTTEAAFTITTENKSEKTKPVSEKGKIWIKGDRYRVDFEDQIIFCNGKTIWTYFKINKEVTIEKYNVNEAEIGPATIFSFYQKGFLSKFDGDYIQDKKKIEKVALTPVDKKKPYFNITLHVDEATRDIRQMEVSYKNGVRQTLKVNSQNANQPLDNKFFEWNATDFPADFVDDLTQ
jgi:outer membrane lipoprotein carrier protein